MSKNLTPAHIFLTGEKHVGKSTLVTSILASTELRYKGLRSISVFDENNDRNVFIIPAETANRDNSIKTPALVGVCSKRHIVLKKPEVFDDVGCSLLEPDNDTQLIVIDEIGNMERDASLYSEKIYSLLERNDIRILGIVQKMAHTELSDTIRNHPNVRMIEVNEENRESLVLEVLDNLQS